MKIMKNLKLNLICFLFNLKPAIKNITTKDNFQKVFNTFKEQYHEIDARTRKEKGILAFHRILLILGLALYNSLNHEFSNQKKLIERIHKILWEGSMKRIVRFLAFFIRKSKDPFIRYLRILGPYNERFFPCPPWEKVEVKLKNGIGWHQIKCPYYNFFRKEGVVELTRAYCDMDKRIAENFPNYIELRRKHTLAKGDKWCDFLYYKK